MLCTNRVKQDVNLSMWCRNVCLFYKGQVVVGLGPCNFGQEAISHQDGRLSVDLVVVLSFLPAKEKLKVTHNLFKKIIKSIAIQIKSKIHKRKEHI